MVKNRGGGPVWLYSIAVLASAALVSALLFAPLITVVGVAAIAILFVGLRAGKGKALGVGVVGALISATIIAPNTAFVPVYAGVVLGAAWLVLFACIAGRKLTRGTPTGLLLLVFIVGIPAAIVSPYGTYAFPVLVVLFLIIVGLASTSMNEDERAMVRKAVVLLACFEAVLGVLETFVIGRWFIGEATGWGHPLINGAIRASGTLSHPLVIGILLLVGLAIVRVSRPWNRLARLAATVLLLAGIVASGSSSVWAVTAVLLLLGFVTRGAPVARTFKAMLLAGGALYLYANPTLLTPATSDLSGRNAVHRLSSITAAPRLLTERPISEAIFGSGWGSAEETYRQGYLINVNFFAIDNQFVTVLMAAGLVGFALFAIFLALMFRRVDKRSFLPVLGLVAMFFSFDVLVWAVPGALFVILVTDVKARSTPPQHDTGARLLALAPRGSASRGLRPNSAAQQGAGTLIGTSPGRAPFA